MQKVTRKIIEDLFKHTCDFSNGNDLDRIFEDGFHQIGGYGSDRNNLVYSLLDNMRRLYPQCGFGVAYINSDSGMRDYIIGYFKHGYTIMLSREQAFHQTTNFTSVNHFIEWLNNHAETINNFGKNDDNGNNDNQLQQSEKTGNLLV